MRRIVELSVVVLAIAVLIVASSAQLPSFKSITSHGVIERFPWLRVEGQWIVDENGNRVQLRGAGCDYTAYEKYDLLESYFQLLSSKGLNYVRLGFNVPGHRPGGGTVYDPVKMDRTLALCEKYDLYAILDCHHYSDIGDWPQDWINTWVEIASRYENSSVVVGYELCNEPYGIDFPPLALDCLNAIRQVDTRHIIFLAEYAKWLYEWMEGRIYTGRRFWIPDGETGSGAVIPNDTQCVYHVHHWPGALTKGATLDIPTAMCEASEYVYFLRFLRETLQRPVWAGEFGSYNYTAPNPQLDHCIEIFNLCDDAGIPWTLWMMEKNYPWDYLVPEPYTTSIIPSDVLRPFNPSPFNMLEYTVNWNRREIGYNRWGSSFYELQPGAWVTFRGPCQVKLVRWTDFYGGVVHSEEIINIPEPNGTITRDWAEYTRIYAYEDLA